jgi:hypothetical protein
MWACRKFSFARSGMPAYAIHLVEVDVGREGGTHPIQACGERPQWSFDDRARCVASRF